MAGRMHVCAWVLLMLMVAGCAQTGGVRGSAAERVIEVGLAADDSTELALLKQAGELIEAGNPAAAIDGPLQSVIAGFQRERESAAGQRVFCARTPAETLLYLANPDHGPKVVVLSWVWAQAYHLKAYALVELGRKSEAQAMEEIAVELSPSNATYLAELGHIHQIAGRSATALELFKRAETAARVTSPDEVETLELTRALRGQGYALGEMWRLDEAEARYRESLEVDPNDEKSRDEIEYLQSLRKDLDSGGK